MKKEQMYEREKRDEAEIYAGIGDPNGAVPDNRKYIGGVPCKYCMGG